MQYYISRAGGIEGPHSLALVQSMLRDGQLTPSDLGAVPGDTDWKPLSELIDCSAATTQTGATPPPLQPQPPMLPLDSPFMIDGKIPQGAHGKSVRQIVEETAAGGRFVIYQYVISVILLSFRRSSPIIYIPPGKSGLGSAFGWTFLTMMLGWWGFPWGIIFTIGALIRNAAGGLDVTEPVLASWIGPQHADALVRNRPKRPSGGLWILRGLILTPFALVALMITQIGKGAAEQDKREERLPGYAQFKQADDFVSRRPTEDGGGNTADSVEAATLFRTTLQALRDAGIADESPGASKKENTRITVWCEARDKRCLFLVKVPDLRHYSDEAKDYICESAWLSAQVSAKRLGLPDDAELAVAVRGLALYDRMIVGRYLRDLDAKADGLDATLKSAIRKTDKHLARKDRMVAYFAPSPR